MSTTKKAPLDPAAGSVPVPESNNDGPEPHDRRSVGHDLNSAHIKRDQPSDIDRTSSPGMATGSDSRDNRPPNWQDQDDILDAASHGHAVDNETTNANISQLKNDQHPHDKSGKESGPTGLSIGQRNMEQEGTSRHDEMQQDLLNGKPSRDGEGSAGLPFDAGK